MDIIKVEVHVTLKRVSDLLCCAFEGGSNYWYTIKEYRDPPRLEFRSDENTIYRHLDLPLNPGGSLLIGDREDENTEYVLDLNAITAGLQTMAREHPRHWGNFLSENDDAETGDVFLQCCLFDEVRYG